MTHSGILRKNYLREAGNFDFNQPQCHQNRSEESNPLRWPDVPEAGHSRMSSAYYEPSVSPSDHENLDDSQNQRELLEKVTNIQFIGAFEAGQRLRRSRETNWVQVFETEVKQAMLLNKKYQLEEARIHLTRAEDEKERIQLDEKTAHSFVLYYLVKGRILLYQQISKESFDECLIAFTEAENLIKKYFKKDSKCLCDIRNDIAKLHYTSFYGNRQEAKLLLKKSLRYSEANNDLEHKAFCYFQLAELYQVFKKPNKVRDNLDLCRKTAIQIRNRKMRSFFLARMKRNEGKLNFSLGEEIKGASCYQSALHRLRKILPEPNILTQLYSNEWKELELECASEISLE